VYNYTSKSSDQTVLKTNKQDITSEAILERYKDSISDFIKKGSIAGWVYKKYKI
jgi:hypothetical protein